MNILWLKCLFIPFLFLTKLECGNPNCNGTCDIKNLSVRIQPRLFCYKSINRAGIYRCEIYIFLYIFILFRKHHSMNLGTIEICIIGTDNTRHEFYISAL